MLKKRLEKGLIQVYTGDGKGKTTAALGQALRAVGAGYRVYMVQFLKGGSTGELEAAKRLEPEFRIFRFEKERGFFWTLSDSEKKELKSEVNEAFEFIREVVRGEKCNILILDEVMGILHNGLLTVDEVCNLLEQKPDKMEIILTGRDVPEKIKEMAHLVTEMRLVKHPFDRGIGSREGIEW
ncbi:MAG: cob(I)yrinic acid a,c-diamide adenosyltransferase [Clostridia bacterium]|jgi:cob(I)alamin adenosyltransferase|nr:cob(I)yrinic acid a,c-diamide adenosyltransferase [Clostridiales bacterium]